MKVLQIIEESPSLDFTLPIFDFVDTEKNQILIFTTKPSYLNWFDHEPEELLKKNKEISFATSVDTLFLSPAIAKIIKNLCKKSRDNINNPLEKILRKFLKYFINYYSNPVKYFEKFFNGLPDYVMIDTRNDLDNGKINHKIFEWVEHYSLKTIGVPVSLYTIEGVQWGPITPFGKYKENQRPIKKFPSNYEYWMGREQKYVINQLADITYKTVGYPGVDNIYIELYSDNPSSEIKKTLNVLLNVRHFGSSRKIGQGTGKYIYQDVHDFFKNLKDCISNYPEYEFRFLIKPHYYVNFKSFNKILKKVGITNYSFLRTSIYNSFKNIDFVIGMHTSVNLVSILFNKPTILYPQVLTQEFMKQDLKLKQMYIALNGFCTDIDEFKIKFESFLDKEKRTKLSTEDQKHIRSFFQDNSIENIIKDLKM